MQRDKRNRDTWVKMQPDRCPWCRIVRDWRHGHPEIKVFRPDSMLVRHSRLYRHESHTG